MFLDDPRSDAELLLATREEIDAFGHFYRRHVRWVLGFLARRLRDPELAADVTSEVFAAALLAVDSYDPARGDPNSWLFGIVSNKLGTAVRRGAAEDRARRRLQMQAVPLDRSDRVWIESLAAGDDSESITDLLSDLPVEQSSLLTGRVIEGRSYEDLAREHALAEATVRKRVSRGLASLRTRLQEGQRR